MTEQNVGLYNSFSLGKIVSFLLGIMLATGWFAYISNWHTLRSESWFRMVIVTMLIILGIWTSVNGKVRRTAFYGFLAGLLAILVCILIIHMIAPAFSA